MAIDGLVMTDFRDSLNVKLGKASQKHIIIQYFHPIRYRRHHYLQVQR